MGKINYNALVEVWTEKDYAGKHKTSKKQVKTYALDNRHYLGD